MNTSIRSSLRSQASPKWLLPLRAPNTGARVIRVIACTALVIFACTTPGFFAKTSVLALLTTVSFVGCVAIGMTFITLSGNAMSFSMGATLSSTTIVFVAMQSAGLLPAILVAFIFSAALCAAQGWIVGGFGSNPIIVSLAAAALIDGLTTLMTGGHAVYPPTHVADVLTRPLGAAPLPLVGFALLAACGQFTLARTRFGRHVYMVGSNRQAARAVAIEPVRTVTVAYLAAGLCTATAAILIAARYSSGDMEFGAGYDYQAISAVLVGGNAVNGGQGSVLRTVGGTLLIAVVQALLLLRGFSTALQYLLIGVIVLIAIMLQYRGGVR